QRVLADQRKIGAAMRVGLEQGPPALLVVATLAVQAELAGMPVAVTAGAGVGHRALEALSVAGVAGDVGVRAAQRKAGGIVVEAHLLPALDELTGAAAR